jgi:periplasmic nitrate reductase NapD
MAAEFPITREVHVAGIVVHVDPQRLQAIQNAITGLSSVEVHGASSEGKLVVTIETATPTEILSRIEAIHEIDGVFSAAIVYQHTEDCDSMNEEISHESHAQGIH